MGLGSLSLLQVPSKIDAKTTQFVDTGDDAALFGEGWQRHERSFHLSDIEVGLGTASRQFADLVVNLLEEQFQVTPVRHVGGRGHNRGASLIRSCLDLQLRYLAASLALAIHRDDQRAYRIQLQARVAQSQRGDALLSSGNGRMARFPTGHPRDRRW